MKHINKKWVLQTVKKIEVMRSLVNCFFRCCNFVTYRLSEMIYNAIFQLNCWRFGIVIGSGVKTHKACPILRISRNNARVLLGNNVVFNNYLNVAWNTRSIIEVGPNAILKMGDSSGISGGLIYCVNKIMIGCNVNIGGGTRIYDSNFHSLNWEDRRYYANDRANTKTAPVIIDDDVFIGTNCIIGKGYEEKALS